MHFKFYDLEILDAGQIYSFLYFSDYKSLSSSEKIVS